MVICTGVVFSRDRLRILESRINDSQQKEKRNTIEIVGVQHVNSNNAFAIPQKICSDAFNVNIGNNDVEKCYVIKNKNMTTREEVGDAYRNIMSTEILCVKLSSPLIKKKIMRSKRLLFLEMKTTAIFILMRV